MSIFLPYAYYNINFNVFDYFTFQKQYVSTSLTHQIIFIIRLILLVNNTSFNTKSLCTIIISLKTYKST